MVQSNQLPSVTLNRPEQFAVFVAPSEITLEATALDPDGTISKVEFFDYDKSLGLGTSVDGKNFVLTVRGLKYGDHAFVSVVTDNGGRTDWSIYKSVFISGLGAVSIKSPAPDSLVPPGPELVLKAVASHPSGVIDKVEFFSNGRMMGPGTLFGQNDKLIGSAERIDAEGYRFTWINVPE